MWLMDGSAAVAISSGNLWRRSVGFLRVVVHSPFTGWVGRGCVHRISRFVRFIFCHTAPEKMLSPKNLAKKLVF